jgi:hypothetical protein
MPWIFLGYFGVIDGVLTNEVGSIGRKKIELNVAMLGVEPCVQGSS